MAKTRTQLEAEIRRVLPGKRGGRHELEIEPTPQQYAALQQVADIGGRTWKAQLINDWATPRLNSYNNAELLRQIMDTFGAEWLRLNCKIRPR